MPPTPAATTGSTLALKEWGAVVCALLEGRQTVLLRKGGIHEKAFAVDGSAAFVIFPTVAHSHTERVRAEHRDLLAAGEAQVDEQRGTFWVRAGVTVVDAVPVRRPERLAAVEDLHIWTAASVRTDRLDFRPRHALQAVVVRAVALPEPVEVVRVPDHAGCRSWVDLPVAWDGRTGRQVVDERRLADDAERVRRTVG